MVAHYMKCIGVVVDADPLRSMEKLRLCFSAPSWWTNSMFLHIRLHFSLGHDIFTA
jgi:hypothetical protein